MGMKALVHSSSYQHYSGHQSFRYKRETFLKAHFSMKQLQKKLEDYGERFKSLTIKAARILILEGQHVRIP